VAVDRFPADFNKLPTALRALVGYRGKAYSHTEMLLLVEIARNLKDISRADMAVAPLGNLTRV
jgi:hypothetical protein